MFPDIPDKYIPDESQVYLAISPAQFNLVHPPQFVNVFCQLVPDVLQVRGKNNLQREGEQMVQLDSKRCWTKKKKKGWRMKTVLPHVYAIVRSLGVMPSFLPFCYTAVESQHLFSICTSEPLLQHWMLNYRCVTQNEFPETAAGLVDSFVFFLNSTQTRRSRRETAAIMYPSWTFYSTLFRTRANQPKELEYNFTVYSTQAFTPLLLISLGVTSL